MELHEGGSNSFSWWLWCLSFLPKNDRVRKMTYSMVVIIVALWVTSAFCALVGTTSWMFAPALVTGIIVGIFGFINFINNLVT